MVPRGETLQLQYLFDKAFDGYFLNKSQTTQKMEFRWTRESSPSRAPHRCLGGARRHRSSSLRASSPATVAALRRAAAATPKNRSHLGQSSSLLSPCLTLHFFDELWAAGGQIRPPPAQIRRPQPGPRPLPLLHRQWRP
jgi:hypothetical protein